MTRPPQLPSPLVFDSQPADRFAELIPWIVRNLHEDLSVNTLARTKCMSPSHFNRAFKSVFGSAPAEFVETLRINEAKRRLSGPKRTLETIAACVGFSDAQTFQRVRMKIWSKAAELSEELQRKFDGGGFRDWRSSPITNRKNV